jgi:hypothetical protein
MKNLQRTKFITKKDGAMLQGMNHMMKYSMTNKKKHSFTKATSLVYITYMYLKYIIVKMFLSLLHYKNHMQA